MGSGKTTAGKQLASKMNCSFCDLDHYIESRYQKTISQIFDEYGEEKFREIEKNMLREVSEIENIVIATGGGTPCFFDNMDHMNIKGVTVYLYSSPEILSKRLGLAKDKRPLIANKSDIELLDFIQNTLDKRNPFYKKAKVHFETENIISPEDIDIFVDKLLNDLDNYKNE